MNSIKTLLITLMATLYAGGMIAQEADNTNSTNLTWSSDQQGFMPIEPQKNPLNPEVTVLGNTRWPLQVRFSASCALLTGITGGLVGAVGAGYYSAKQFRPQTAGVGAATFDQLNFNLAHNAVGAVAANAVQATPIAIQAMQFAHEHPAITTTQGASLGALAGALLGGLGGGVLGITVKLGY